MYNVEAVDEGAWLGCRRVIAHVQEIVAASGLKAANIRVLLTGHSLGGALAGLAAHDLVTHCGLTNCQVSFHAIHPRWPVSPSAQVPKAYLHNHNQNMAHQLQENRIWKLRKC